MKIYRSILFCIFATKRTSEYINYEHVPSTYIVYTTFPFTALQSRRIHFVHRQIHRHRRRTHAQIEINDDLMTREANTKFEMSRILLFSTFLCLLIGGVDCWR